MSDAQALVDAHHHVWNLDLRPQPWLDEPGHEPIRRSFSSHALRSAATRPIAGRRLTSTVVVQCIASVPETRDLLALADSDPLIGAVVGWADLTSPRSATYSTTCGQGPRAGTCGPYATSCRASPIRTGSNGRMSRGDCERSGSGDSDTTC